MNPRAVIVVVFLVAVAAIVAFTLRGPPRGDAPATTISMLYGTEKQDWIEAALPAFQAAHPEIRIELKGMGSLSAAEAILEGKEKPTIFSPADSAVLNLLADDWETRHHKPLVDAGTSVEPLVITPLVYAIWSDRAEVLQAAAVSDGHAGISWKTLHKAVASNQGWPAIGGKPDWGFVKLGHTDPTRSNSGLQTLLLLTLEYHGKTGGLTTADVLDPAYQAWIKEIEQGVPKFETSTGTFMTDMVRFGPSKYDIAVVYENLAIAQIENAQGRWGNLNVYYPTPTLWSDHPGALLAGDWVTPEAAAAGKLFLAHLRSRPVQETALRWGFRPGDPSVPIQSSDATNPFTRYAAYGVRVDLPPVATPPEGAVTRNLLTMWSRVVDRR